MSARASIVITNYNYAGFVGEAIDSALAQTLPGVEVIVVDDGSTDDSRQVIESYGNAVTALLKQNGGQTSAMNAGAAASSGRFVVFLDADDALEPTVLERAAELFDDCVSRVFWRLREVDTSGRRTGRTWPYWGEPGTGELRELTLRYGPESYVSPPQSGNAFAREVIERACPLPELERGWGTGSAHADAFLVDLAGLLGAARELPDPGGTYRVHAENDCAGLGPLENFNRIVRLYDERCKRLARHCETLGLEADPAAWRRDSWIIRAVRAHQELEAAVPSNAAVTLVEDGELGLGIAGTRPAQQFVERNGIYFGSPADDDEAIRELERVRGERGGYLAVLWPAFWWFETYPRFAAHLDETARCVTESDELRLYSLT